MQSDNISNSICQNSWYSVFENTFYICNAGQNIFACIKFLNFRWIIASLILYRATFSKAHDDVLINGPCIRLVLKWYTRRFSYCLDDNIHSFYYSQFYLLKISSFLTCILGWCIILPNTNPLNYLSVLRFIVWIIAAWKTREQERMFDETRKRQKI